MRRWIRRRGRHALKVIGDGKGAGLHHRFQRLRVRVQTSASTRVKVARIRAQAGMSTAEYAVGTIAACAFAGLLFKIVSSPEVRKMLSDIISRALRLAG
ncbi:DUF4244 domain-containing protein [Sphaerisporangium sp. NPDC004334]